MSMTALLGGALEMMVGRPQDQANALDEHGNLKPGLHTPPQVAVKNDSDKDPWHLAPWDAFRAVVKVMAFGANKYAERNWEKGFDWHRLHRAAIEHLTSWWEGQDKDPETGYSHLWHAGCCVMFLIAHELRGIGNDDRPKYTKKDM